MKGWTAVDGKLELVQRPDTAPGPDEVSIRVRAAGVNRADLLQKAGLYPPPPGISDLLGLECAGTLEAVGSEVTHLVPGQPVCALLAGGGYAERVVCPALQVVPVPVGMDLVQAAALPEVFATAWLNLYMEGALEPGQSALLHAGGSGVGTAAIQLCKAFDNPCFVTAGSEEKIERCLALGAQAGALRQQGDWADKVREFAPDGVDLILDPVGASYFGDNLAVLGTGGRLVLIGLMGGHSTELNLAGLLSKRQHIIGSTLRARSPQSKGHILAQLQIHVWPLFESGQLVPVVDRTWPWDQAEEAQQQMASNQNFGKIVLEFPAG